MDYKNFRLKQMVNLQVLIYEKMWHILQQEYGNTNQITKSALGDIEKVIGWIAMFSKPNDYVNEKPNRVLAFSYPSKRK